MEPREYALSFALERDHWWFKAKRRLVRGLLRRFGHAGGRGLDLGCGTGATLAELGRVGTWIGADVAPAALGFCQQRGLRRLVAASAACLPFRDGVFDACLCLDLLYHRGVPSDRAALRECHRVLRVGGLLVLTDSALPWLRSAHDEAMHGARRYTRRELVTGLRAAGLTPLFASYAFCLLFPITAAMRLLRGWMGHGKARVSDVFPVPRPLNALLGAVQALERALLRVTRLPVGSSVVCVARKDPGARA